MIIPAFLAAIWKGKGMQYRQIWPSGVLAGIRSLALLRLMRRIPFAWSAASVGLRSSPLATAEREAAVRRRNCRLDECRFIAILSAGL
jgi:hypothetical protein